jgi:hypothetical protein
MNGSCVVLWLVWYLFLPLSLFVLPNFSPYFPGGSPYLVVLHFPYPACFFLPVYVLWPILLCLAPLPLGSLSGFDPLCLVGSLFLVLPRPQLVDFLLAVRA